jgi:ribosomal protein S27AE
METEYEKSKLKRKECPQCFKLTKLMESGVCFYCEVENNKQECPQCGKRDLLTSNVCMVCEIRNEIQECSKCHRFKFLNELNLCDTC